METTVKRVSIALSKKDLEDLERLSKYFGESRSQIVKRAINLLSMLNQEENN